MAAGRDDTKPRQTPPTRPRSKASGNDVGVALRSVYQKTVEEAVPDEFLDLLGKLG